MEVGDLDQKSQPVVSLSVVNYARWPRMREEEDMVIDVEM